MNIELVIDGEVQYAEDYWENLEYDSYNDVSILSTEEYDCRELAARWIVDKSGELDVLEVHITNLSSDPPLSSGPQRVYDTLNQITQEALKAHGFDTRIKVEGGGVHISGRFVDKFLNVPTLSYLMWVPRLKHTLSEMENSGWYTARFWEAHSGGFRLRGGTEPPRNLQYLLCDIAPQLLVVQWGVEALVFLYDWSRKIDQISLDDHNLSGFATWVDKYSDVKNLMYVRWADQGD